MQGVKGAFGQDIFSVIQLDKKNEDIAEANQNAHTLKILSSPEEKSFLLDIIDCAKTKAAKEGSSAAFCYIFGVGTCAAAREEAIKELSH